MKIHLYLLLITFFIVTFHLPALAVSDPPAKGETLPDVNLPVPENPDHRSYLGVSGSGSFKIPQVKARVVIIEIFSMYCPYCQREAPEVNSLFNRIERNSTLKGKIKLIGIGAGNSSFEVDIFRKKYKILSPLFPDENFSIHKIFGEVRTPYFIAIKISKDGTHNVIYSKLGGLKGAESFLESILKLSGLEKEG